MLFVVSSMSLCLSIVIGLVSLLYYLYGYDTEFGGLRKHDLYNVTIIDYIYVSNKNTKYGDYGIHLHVIDAKLIQCNVEPSINKKELYKYPLESIIEINIDYSSDMPCMTKELVYSNAMYGYFAFLTSMILLLLSFITGFICHVKPLRTQTRTNYLPIRQNEQTLEMTTLTVKQPLFYACFVKNGMDNTTECVICSSQIINKEMFIKLACCHEFHKICIEKWFETNNHTCPTCRQRQIS